MFSSLLVPNFEVSCIAILKHFYCYCILEFIEVFNLFLITLYESYFVYIEKKDGRDIFISVKISLTKIYTNYHYTHI